MQVIRTLSKLNKTDFTLIPESEFWNKTQNDELSIHKVHVYPAKFPSLIAQQAFEYAKMHRMKIHRVADVFCGCGTVAVEAKRKGYDFWGCDLNPVAILLSKVKTNDYDSNQVRIYSNIIEEEFRNRPNVDTYDIANERLQYWFVRNQYNDLYKLKNIITNLNCDDNYRELFLCVFSSILKSTSKWLTKSIKPQIDPNKEIHDVLDSFIKQVNVFIKAIDEEDYNHNSHIQFSCQNVLDITQHEYVNLIISSPPYVTSYEYADLHQLSTLWLDYVEDYRDLREDSIGSRYQAENIVYPNLTNTAQEIAIKFKGAQRDAIARYYSQMYSVISKAYQLLVPRGRCVFVIGDTEYQTVKIQNARCLSEALIDNGFIIEEISKRRVENKFLPSHRDSIGRFSSSKEDRQIYSQEYVIIGRKK